jgi:hypothetical protein
MFSGWFKQTTLIAQPAARKPGLVSISSATRQNLGSARPRSRRIQAKLSKRPPTYFHASVVTEFVFNTIEAVILPRRISIVLAGPGLVMTSTC